MNQFRKNTPLRRVSHWPTTWRFSAIVLFSICVTSTPSQAFENAAAQIEYEVATRFWLEEDVYYKIERSTNLLDWEGLQANVLGAGEFHVLHMSKEDAAGFYFRAVPISESWVEVWSDEFDGAMLDRTKWANDVNANGGGNNELQYYSDDPQYTYLEEGRLIIQALDTDYEGLDGSADYTSGKVHTKFRGSWKYGKIEVRARLPIGQGIWPAIWMLPLPNEYGTWAASGEIDIVELVGNEPSTVHGTIHYGGVWPQNTSSGESFRLESGTFSDDFHVFAIEWESGSLRWYVDGELYQTQDSWYSSNGTFPAPFDQPFYLIMNVAVGGNWPGSPNSSTPFPAKMEVDYVRVYKWID